MRRCWAVAMVVALGCGSAAPRPVTKQVAPPVAIAFPTAPAFRLPTTFAPTGYRARLALDDSPAFGGHIEIAGVLDAPTAVLWLNAVGLEIASATASTPTGVRSLEISQGRADQLIGLRAQGDLPPGPITLVLDYRGKVAELEPVAPREPDRTAKGLFRRIDGDRRFLFSMSEPVYARRMFPCIDEPDRKVPWELALDVDRALVAASNTPIVSETPIGRDRKRVVFAKTRPLPSYLVAFAVGPFTIIDGGTSKAGVPIRVLGTRDLGAAGQTSAALLGPVLDRFEAWLGLPYAYGKLDLVVVPHLGWGAMENPGLVTMSTTIPESDVKRTIVHELAHQWFGNLVTMAWWDDLWLNEGFAYWLANKAELDAPPDHGMAVRQFRAGGHVHQDVTATSLDTELVNWGMVARSGAVLELLEATLGTEAFRRALHHYLDGHVDGSATSADLARAFAESEQKPELGLSILALLDGPLPTITPIVACQGGKARVSFEGSPARPIDLCVVHGRAGARAETCGRFDDASPSIELPGACPTWLIVRPGLFATAMKRKAVESVLARGATALLPAEREALFDDAPGDRTRLAVLTRFLEPAHVFRASELEMLARVVKFVPGDQRARFEAWVARRLAPAARALHLTPRAGHEREDLALIDLVSRVGNPEMTADARPLVARYLDDPGYEPLAAPIIGLATRGDPKLVASIFPRVGQDDRTIARGLSRLPDLVMAIGQEPSAMTWPSWSFHELLEETCDPVSRDALVALESAHPQANFEQATREMTACLATKPEYDAPLRALLR